MLAFAHFCVGVPRGLSGIPINGDRIVKAFSVYIRPNSQIEEFSGVGVRVNCLSQPDIRSACVIT